MQFDWLISSLSKAVLDCQKGILDRNSKAYFNKQTKWTKKIFTQVLDFLNESFTLNEIEQLKKIPSQQLAAFKEDTNMFSSKFREGFDL